MVKVVTWFTLIILLYSCASPQDAALLPELEQAEALMYQYPDSALKVLENMPPPAATERLQHATWSLFLTQARYKSYLTQSDSLINLATPYFMQGGDPQRKALVLYLQGALNREFKEVEKATEYYLEASKEVVKTTDNQLTYLIHTGLGGIYIFRGLYDYVQKAYETSYKYALLTGNKVYITNSLFLLGRVHSAYNDWDKSIEYYKQAMEIAKTSEPIRLLSSILTELAGVYLEVKEYTLALQYAKEALSIRKTYELNESIASRIIGNAYYLMGKNDSASYYLEKATLSQSIYTRRDAYQLLYNISKQNKDYPKALEYSEKQLFYSDSIRKADRTTALAEMQEKYNQEKVINEKNQLKIEKDRVVRNGLLLLMLFLGGAAAMVYFYQRKILHKERTIQKKEEQIRQYLFRIHANEAIIGRNNNRIQELTMEKEQQRGIEKILQERENAIREIEQQNELLKSENGQLRENISRYAGSLQQQSRELDNLQELSEENLRLRDREKFLCNELLKRIKVLSDLKKDPKYLDVIRWAELTEAVDWLYEGFTTRLTRDISSLTESDLQVCCLIKLHLTIPEIALMLGISPTSVSKRKLRLKERIIQENRQCFTESQTIETLLWEY